MNKRIRWFLMRRKLTDLHPISGINVQPNRKVRKLLRDISGWNESTLLDPNNRM